MREVGHSPEVESDALASEALARGSKQDVLWRHGWNRLRKTRESRFPSTSPSLGSGLRQKQGRISPLRRFGMTKSTEAFLWEPYPSIEPPGVTRPSYA